MKGVALDQLPAHEATPMSAAERAALADLARHPGVPAEGFLTLGDPRGERWSLFPERMNGDDPMTEVRYYPPEMELGRGGYQEMDEAQRQAWRNSLVGSELGSVWSQDLAVALIEHARRNPGDVPVEQALEQAGFSFAHEVGAPNKPTQVYTRDSSGGFFNLLVSPRGMWLMFEEADREGWRNLIVLHTADQGMDGSYHPIRWPGGVADPRRALAGMVGVAVAHWEALAAGQAPKPKASKPS